MLDVSHPAVRMLRDLCGKVGEMEVHWLLHVAKSPEQERERHRTKYIAQHWPDDPTAGGIWFHRLVAYAECAIELSQLPEPLAEAFAAMMPRLEPIEILEAVAGFFDYRITRRYHAYLRDELWIPNNCDELFRRVAEAVGALSLAERILGDEGHECHRTAERELRDALAADALLRNNTVLLLALRESD